MAADKSIGNKPPENETAENGSDGKSLAALRVNNVSRAFGDLPVLDGISLTVRRGEFVALVGPSGCGKTTLLNLLSGADQPTSGTISRPPTVRMVYQADGLLPWLTVRENIALGLRSKRGRRREEETRRRGEKDVLASAGGEAFSPSEAEQMKFLLDMIGMDEYAAYYPYQLSGGMRQRVELARALGGDTDLLLLDEPFSALDYIKRLELRRSLAEMLRTSPAQVVLVTHDIEEACMLADRVLVLSSRPARIQCEIAIELPRPRPVGHPEVTAATKQVLRAMGLENL